MEFDKLVPVAAVEHRGTDSPSVICSPFQSILTETCLVCLVRDNPHFSACLFLSMNVSLITPDPICMTRSPMALLGTKIGLRMSDWRKN
jgi:hypothetical protein